MALELTPVWSQVEKLLGDGISVIPVRDKDEPPFIKKSPYGGWKKHQRVIIEKDDLFSQMERHNTTAVAIICGKVSGNLEVVDIDVKWFPGIDAKLFKDLSTLYPDLFNKLRIHSTPSGGYHLLFRTQEPFVVPGNQKLAKRPATESELLISPKDKSKCFFETRGEGGYVLAPPSMGYGVYQDVPIPLLSEQERAQLINLCLCYNEVVKEDKQYKKEEDSDYYEVNPFEDFNRSVEGSEILLNNGWVHHGSSGDYVHFSRPGSQSKGLHASFIKSKRIFYIFTTNSELENEKGYKPSSVLAVLNFGGDKSKTYQYLVERGYGKIKPKVEERIAKNKAMQRKELPANASEHARELHSSITKKLDDTYPFGTFWSFGEEGEVTIEREAVYRVSEGLGFRAYKQSVVRIDEYFIYEQTERQYFDALKAYIKEEDFVLYNEICNAYESFIQRAGAFTMTRIALLDTSQIIKDTPKTCYKFFQNGYLFITAEKCSFRPYENLAGKIWHKSVQQRQYVEADPGGKYLEFIKLALSADADHVEYVLKTIGYLAHDYKDDTTGYIVTLVEQCEDPKHGGGSGKNVFTSLLRNTITIKVLPGSQVRQDEKFMQAWNGERIFALSDVDKKFNFLFLKELSTGSGLVKKLYIDEEIVDVSEMPKFLVSTNYSYEVSDGGLKRRIIPLEFSDFFTKKGGVDVHFGCHFPKGWDGEDWAGFDAVIAEGIRLWLASGMKLVNIDLSEGGWLKQFDQSYGSLTREFISSYWEKWKDNFVPTSEFNTLYTTFLNENNAHKNFSLSSIRMNKALEDWCNKHDYILLKDQWESFNGIGTKGRKFLPKSPF